jgi:hypothetical protein
MLRQMTNATGCYMMGNWEGVGYVLLDCEQDFADILQGMIFRAEKHLIVFDS